MTRYHQNVSPFAGNTNNIINRRISSSWRMVVFPILMKWFISSMVIIASSSSSSSSFYHFPSLGVATAFVYDIRQQQQQQQRRRRRPHAWKYSVMTTNWYGIHLDRDGIFQRQESLIPTTLYRTSFLMATKNKKKTSSGDGDDNDDDDSDNNNHEYSSIISPRKKQNNHEKWQPYYEALSDFQQRHGHCELLKSGHDDNDDENDTGDSNHDNDSSLSSLYWWLQEQRKQYRDLKLGRKTKLTRKRAVALERLGAIPMELLEL